MIELKNLKFGYQKEAPLFNGINLDFQLGNIYGLLGRNGVGKTTLLKLIAGLLYPTGGTCRLGKQMPQKRSPEYLTEIFLIPEEIELPPVSAKEFARMLAPFYPNFNPKQYFDYLENFGVSENTNSKNLSYGQNKQILISFGLATNSRFLLLDEPTNGLDIPSKSILRKMLVGALTENRSYIISTHQIRDLETILDPLIILENGQVVLSETLESVAQKYSFKVLDTNELPEIIYSEKRLDGYHCVCHKSDNSFTNPNLELLFNAVIHKTELFHPQKA